MKYCTMIGYITFKIDGKITPVYRVVVVYMPSFKEFQFHLKISHFIHRYQSCMNMYDKLLLLFLNKIYGMHVIKPSQR